jgi:hypothetical protein
VIRRTPQQYPAPWILLLGLLAGEAGGQTILATPLNATSGQRGTMFDIENLSSATLWVTGFEQHFLGPGGAAAVEIRTVQSGGSYVPVSQSPASWDLVAIVPWLWTLPVGSVTPLPLALSIPIAPGTRRGFYITATALTAAYVAYTDLPPGSLGTPWASNGVAAILAGEGRAYPFGAAFAPRGWNGRLLYTLAPPAADYETNDALATILVGGVVGTPYARAVSRACTGGTTTLSLQSTQLNLGYDVAITQQPLHPASSGAPVTVSGQIVNVLLADPSLVFLTSAGPAPGLAPFLGAITFTVGLPSQPLLVSLQSGHLSPAHPDGVALGQGCEVRVEPSSTQLFAAAGPTGDDTSVEIPTGCLPLFGSAVSTISVTSNGRVLFEGVNPAPVPSPAATLQDPPSVGAWTDLAPNLGGSVVAGRAIPGLLQVEWIQVPYSGFPALAATFGVHLDQASGVLTIHGLSNFAPFPPVPPPLSNAMWLGLSAGLLGATDPGPRNFLPGASGTPPANRGAIYQFGPAGSLAPGVSMLVFTPAPGGLYSWAAY